MCDSVIDLYKYNAFKSGTLHVSTGALALSAWEGYTWLNSYNPDSKFWSRFGHFITDLYMSKFIQTLNHEYGGHGYRARDMGIKKVDYVFFGGAHAFPKDLEEIQEIKKNTSRAAFIQKGIIGWFGGIEASCVYEKKLANRMFRNDTIALKDTFMYLQSIVNDRWGYIWLGGKNIVGKEGVDDSEYYCKDVEDLVITTKALGESYKDRKGTLKEQDALGKKLDDTNNYVAGINEYYQKKTLSMKKLKLLNMLNLGDPFIWYSFFCIGDYLARGKVKPWKYPMMRIGKFAYMPMTKLNLAPYGPEGELTNFMKFGDISGRVTLTYGQTAGMISMGLGFDLDPIYINKYFALGGSLYGWRQPELFTEDPYSPEKLGVLAAINLRVEFTKYYFGFDIGGGYKTKGYIQGKSVNSGPFTEAGLLLLF